MEVMAEDQEETILLHRQTTSLKKTRTAPRRPNTLRAIMISTPKLSELLVMKFATYKRIIFGVENDH